MDTASSAVEGCPGLSDVDGVPALRIKGLSKTFPGQVALSDLALEVRAGEIHALIGQNGSGKSTLIKVLAGYHEPDDGATIELNGAEYLNRSIRTVDRHSIGFVHQDLALVWSMNSVDNIALSKGFEKGRTGGIRWKSEVAEARRLIAEFGEEFDVLRPVADLTAVQRTVVAMARAVGRGTHGDSPLGLLVLDEPTASLPSPEVHRLFEALRRVAERGTGILYVSHHLDEVFQLSDRVSVLRDGRNVATAATADVDHADLVELMLGRRLGDLYTAPPRPGRTVMLSLSRVGGGRIRGLSIEVHSGEIVGFTGIVGSGRDDLASLLFGAVPGRTGAIRIEGQPLRVGSPRNAIEAGMAMVPIDRINKGVVINQTVRENMTLPLLRPLVRRLKIHRGMERAEVGGWVRHFGITPSEPECPISVLSGGNQQKAVLAKWMRMEPKVLVLDEPTQGVDVGAKASIFKLLAEAAAGGAAIVYSSVEAEDLANLCDRVVVLRDGAVASVLSGDALSAQRITEESISTHGGRGSGAVADPCDPGMSEMGIR